jgi:hypothetical protein
MEGLQTAESSLTELRKQSGKAVYQVFVHPTSDDTVRGFLEFREGLPLLMTESETGFKADNTDISFSMDFRIIVDQLGVSRQEKFTERIRVRLHPVVFVQRPYAHGLTQVEERIWPPSTEGWFGRVGQTFFKENLVSIIVQEVINSSDYWISIIDLKSGELYEFHRIHSYEVPILTMMDNREWGFKVEEAAYGGVCEDTRKLYLSILDGPPPSFEKLVQLTWNTPVRDLRLGKTMRETLLPLIPNSGSKRVDDEVMAYLAWVLSDSKDPLPELSGENRMDPLDFIYEVHKACPLLMRLMNYHIWQEMESTEPHEYLSFLHNLHAGKLKIPGRPRFKSLYGKYPYRDLYSIQSRQVFEQFYRVYPYIKELNESKEVLTELPVSRKEAKQSVHKWYDRMALINADFGFTTRTVRNQLLGLHTLIYLGRAHKWPHKHMYWSATIKSNTRVPEHIQIMLLPRAAAEQVMRERKTFEIEFSMWKYNYNLYDLELRQWNISLRRILSSLKRRCSLKSLKHTSRNQKKIERITPDEARILDITSTIVPVDQLERGYLPDLDTRQLKTVLNSLQERGICDIMYFTKESWNNLLIILQGEVGRVYSIMRALLRYSPTTLAHISKGGLLAFAFLRLPYKTFQFFMNSFEKKAAEAGLQARCVIPKDVRIYTKIFYQRLLRDDGTWDDNASYFLEQART